MTWCFTLCPDECNIEELRGVLANTRWSQWVQVFPLTEDIELCQLPPLSQVHLNLDYTTSHRAQLSQTQEVRPPTTHYLVLGV